MPASLPVFPLPRITLVTKLSDSCHSSNILSRSLPPETKEQEISCPVAKVVMVILSLSFVYRIALCVGKFLTSVQGQKVLSACH